MAQKVRFHDRRYIGTKETAAYCIFDSSKAVNIGAYSGRFNLDLVKIDFRWGAVAGLIGGIWDIINDTFAGVLVDRTKTRWGKFKPYLLAFAAGAMMYVVVEELIPEMSEGKHSNWGTIAFSLGFVLMMILDVALG